MASCRESADLNNSCSNKTAAAGNALSAAREESDPAEAEAGLRALPMPPARLLMVSELCLWRASILSTAKEKEESSVNWFGNKLLDVFQENTCVL